MIILATFLFLAVCVGPPAFLYWRRWHIVTKNVSARRDGHHLTGVGLCVRRGRKTWYVQPSDTWFCLDPSQENFVTAMDAYMAKAKGVMASLRTMEGVGTRQRNGVWVEIPDTVKEPDNA